MRRGISKKAIAELRSISAKHRGIVRPEMVVDAAKKPTSPLHAYFDWDNTEAARKWRLNQAGALLRFSFEYIQPEGIGATVAVRVFTSLTTERNRDGGFRQTLEIMSDKQMREQMLSDALAELDAFTAKYARLKELAAVFTAIRRVRK